MNCTRGWTVPRMNYVRDELYQGMKCIRGRIVSGSGDKSKIAWATDTQWSIIIVHRGYIIGILGVCVNGGVTSTRASLASWRTVPGDELYQGMNYTRGWTVPGDELYQGMDCTRWQTVPGGELYQGMDCTMGWILLGGELYQGTNCTRNELQQGTNCTRGWTVPGDKLYQGMNCTRGWTVPGDELY